MVEMVEMVEMVDVRRNMNWKCRFGFHDYQTVRIAKCNLTVTFFGRESEESQILLREECKKCPKKQYYFEDIRGYRTEVSTAYIEYELKK